MENKNPNFKDIIKKMDIALSKNDVYIKYNKYYWKKENTVYYYNTSTKHHFHIICITESQDNKFKFDNEIINKIKNKINKVYQKSEFKILKLVVSSADPQVNDSDPLNVIASLSYSKWVNDISAVLPNLDFEMDFDIMSAISAQRNKSGGKNNLNADEVKTFKKLKSFQYKTQISKLPIFTTLFILTIFLPLIISFVWFIISKNLSFSLSTGSFLLLFGGLNHDLLLGANQWWRIMVYPFIENGFLSIILNGILFFISLRYTEVIIGKLNTLLLLLFYPILGIIFTMVDANLILVGPWVIFSLFLGANLIAIYKKHDYSSLLIKPFLTIMLFWIILSGIFSNGLFFLFYMILSILVGASFGLLINHNYKQISYLFFIPIVILISIVISMIVLVVLEETSNLVPSINNDVLATIYQYENWHLMKSGSFNNFVNNYYKSPGYPPPPYFY